MVLLSLHTKHHTSMCPCCLQHSMPQPPTWMLLPVFGSHLLPTYLRATCIRPTYIMFIQCEHTSFLPNYKGGIAITYTTHMLPTSHA